MTIVFNYYFSVRSIIFTLYYLLYPIVGYYYLIKASNHNLKELDSSFLIKRLAIINIFMVIFSHLHPYIDLTEYSQTDFIIFKLILSFLYLFPLFIYLYSFGYCIFLFGKRNKSKTKGYFKRAGLFLIISYAFDIISTLIYLLCFFDFLYFNQSSPFNYLGIITIVLDNLSNTLYYVGFFFIIIYGIIYKNKYLLISILILIFGTYGGNILNLIMGMLSI